MPGVLNSNFHCEYSREVGKMAFSAHPDLLLLNNENSTDLEDIADRILESSDFFFPGGFNLTDFADSDCDLSDHELTMDLFKFLDSHDMDTGLKLHRIKCDDDCNSCSESPSKYNKYRVSELQDPFMGLSQSKKGEKSSNTMLGQLMGQIDYDSECEDLLCQKNKETKIFSAWNTPKTDDEPDFLQVKSSVSWGRVYDEEEDDDLEEVVSHDVPLPETPSPSTKSETVAGDDSDVDIETITDVPRSADSCGYLSLDSSSTSSPRGSPSLPHKIKSGSLLTILSKSVNTGERITARSSDSLTVCDASSSSSVENLISSRSVLGQKRKYSKERKLHWRQQSQPAYQHILCASNSVNFHDYAMSPSTCSYPSSPSSTETGRPTVLSKRMYRRNKYPVDASEKEKQHHHNQLERNRRQKLADLFVDLRDEVPKISTHPKASKVLILNEATLFIRELQRKERQQQEEIARELRRKELLRNQLRSLQAQISINSVK